jgi:hypothetical protein
MGISLLGPPGVLASNRAMEFGLRLEPVTAPIRNPLMEEWTALDPIRGQCYKNTTAIYHGKLPR